MAMPRGKTKEIVLSVLEIQTLIEIAICCIDTSKQYEIREHLQKALEKCSDIREHFDPL